MNHGIIFTGVNYFDVARKSGGATRIENFCRPYGWSIDIVDYFPFWTKEQLENYLKKTVADRTKFIGFSYTWLSQYNNFQERVDFIKSLYPKLKIIVGGQTPFTTDLGADYYVYGYGEEAMVKILEHEFNKKLPPIYTKHFGGRYIDGIHNVPSHNLREYGNSYRDQDFLIPSDVLTIELSRGCKFSCKFCNYSFIGMKEDTSRSEESIYKELNENYQRWGITNYAIADDTLNDRNEKLIKLRNVVNRLSFKPNFTAYVRIDLIHAHPEHLELLSEAGVWGHYYGIETFNHESGKIIGKGLNPEIVKNLLLDTRDYFQKYNDKYRGTISMIAGLPKESIGQMIESHEWLIKNWEDQCFIWYALHIVKSKGSLQAFGENLSKFGYITIDPPDDKLFDDLLKKSLITKFKEETVYWKNGCTNIYDVLNLVWEFRKKPVGLSNYALWSYLKLFDHIEAMNIKLPPYEVFLYDEYVKRAEISIREYINKKLT